MSGHGNNFTRRDLLGCTAGGFLAGLATLHTPEWSFAEPAAGPPKVRDGVRVGFASGNSRADNVFQSLKRIEADIKKGLTGRKRVVIKPNLVSTTNQLAATHAECMEGILQFIRPLTKAEIVIAESAASAPTAEGFDHYGYGPVAGKYGARLVDLDREPNVVQHVVDEKFRPRPVRFSKYLLDPAAYVISAAVMKTHDRAVVTLSLKNLLVGAIGKDTGFRWGAGSKGSTDKWLVHGGNANEGIHYNMFSLAKVLRPDLAVIDGFEGMEHNGPVAGTPLRHQVAVASTDWLAADRVAVELMGFDFARIGYLTFCAKGGMGESDLARIEVLGPDLKAHIRRYQPHDNIEEQYKWLKGA